MSKYLKKPIDSASFIANSPLRSGSTPDDPSICDGLTVVPETATLSGAGAVPITSSIVEITTTGVNALTLADGAEGQILYLVMVADGGNGTLTPANFGQGTTLTFADAGDACTLLFTNANWYVVGNQGVALA